MARSSCLPPWLLLLTCKVDDSNYFLNAGCALGTVAAPARVNLLSTSQPWEPRAASVSTLQKKVQPRELSRLLTVAQLMVTMLCLKAI
jgi:hypothetical protein